MSSAEGACVRCRERKIRCGRERNRCANCIRDKVKCDYAAPGKRVNHIKLLCKSVSQVQEQLAVIENGMASLLSIATLQGPEPRLEAYVEDSSSLAIPEANITPQALQRRREAYEAEQSRIVDRATSPGCHSNVERYRGPEALDALCQRFADMILTIHTDEESHDIKENLRNRLKIVHLEAYTNISGSQMNAIQRPPIGRLPSKQLFMVVQAQFFQQKHYPSEIFDQLKFQRKVDQLYSRRLGAGDETWVICLQTMTLLVLGPEAMDPGVDPSSLLAAMDLRILMAPQLIHIQTLTLLAGFAQQFYPLYVAESIHTIACVLAKSLGAFCQRPAVTSQEHISNYTEDMGERVRAYRCLYAQHFQFAIARGSICRFLCPDGVTLHELALEDANPRMQLAQMQETLLRSSHQTNGSARYQILDGLDRWVRNRQIFTPELLADCTTLDIHQTFLATRIAILSYEDTSSNFFARSISDARVTCAMLLLVCSACTPEMAEELAPTDQYSIPVCASVYSHIPVTKVSEHTIIRQSLLEQFPVTAFFVLATGLATSHVSARSTDIELLHRMCSYFLDIGLQRPADNHIHKLGRVFRAVLDSIKLLHSKVESSRSAIADSQGADRENVMTPHFFIDPSVATKSDVNGISHENSRTGLETVEELGDAAPSQFLRSRALNFQTGGVQAGWSMPAFYQQNNSLREPCNLETLYHDLDSTGMSFLAPIGAGSGLDIDVSSDEMDAYVMHAMT